MDLNRFTCEKLSEHIYRIVDALEVACYLVVGEEKACLLDTCPGEGNIRAFVESITDLPLIVVVSHAHMDHCGGAGYFSKVFLKEEEKPILAVHRSQAFRKTLLLFRKKSSRIYRITRSWIWAASAWNCCRFPAIHPG